MYPSSSRIFAISTLSFDAGTSTLECFARTAFRRRVSISAIGSVIVTSRGPVLAPHLISRGAPTPLSPLACGGLLPRAAPGAPVTSYLLRSTFYLQVLPAAFRHAGHVALQRQLAEAQAA